MHSSQTSIYTTVALNLSRCHACHDLTLGDAIFLPSPVLRVSTSNTCSYPDGDPPTSNNDRGSDPLTMKYVWNATLLEAQE